jgi:hypothetical protein
MVQGYLHYIINATERTKIALRTERGDTTPAEALGVVEADLGAETATGAAPALGALDPTGADDTVGLDPLAVGAEPEDVGANVGADVGADTGAGATGTGTTGAATGAGMGVMLGQDTVERGTLGARFAHSWCARGLDQEK